MNLETRLNNQPLDLRIPTNESIFRIQSEVVFVSILHCTLGPSALNLSGYCVSYWTNYIKSSEPSFSYVCTLNNLLPDLRHTKLK